MSETQSQRTIRVFTGPSLPPKAARASLPSAACHPPAALGDIYQAATKHPRAIVLIDGYFENRPAVWHKELLWALHQGIAIYGASSMGALRAVEMLPFGMIGVGRIFEDYRDGLLEDDDDVAVVHAPEELDYTPLSEAMVNVIATLKRAVSEGVLDPALGESICAVAKGQHYRERTWQSVVAGTRDATRSSRQLDGFARWLSSGAVNQKQDDALAALAQVRKDLAGPDQDGLPSPQAPSFAFEVNCFWDYITQRTSQSLLDVGDAAVCQSLWTDDGVPAEPHRSRGLLRLLALALAERDARRIDAQRLVEQFQRHRAAFRLEDCASLERWLAANGLNRAGLHKLMCDNVLIESVIADLEPLLATAVLDELRLSGDYPAKANP